MSVATAAAPRGIFRTLLVLGRVSNLPTVWSNCLAGWLLAQGSDYFTFYLLCAGGTFLYVGGMYLNDAFDAQFDQQHRPERPIPAGNISLAAVWLWGLGWLSAGLVCLMFLGKTSAICALLLALSILLYDAVHKMFAFSPVLMASCRFFLILVAASTGTQGVTGMSVWVALVLACYIVGLSYIARKESVKSALRYWPCIFLTAPLDPVLGNKRRAIPHSEPFSGSNLFGMGFVVPQFCVPVAPAKHRPVCIRVTGRDCDCGFFGHRRNRSANRLQFRYAVWHGLTLPEIHPGNLR